MAKDRWLCQKPNGIWRLRAFVPKHLQAIAGRKEITQSFETMARAEALGRYRIAAAGVQELFNAWQAQVDLGDAPPKDRTPKEIAKHCAKLNAARINKWCADHYLEVVDAEFAWRAETWKLVQANPDAFMNGKLIAHPTSDHYNAFCEAMTSRERFAACVRHVHEKRLDELKSELSVADCSRKGEIVARLLSDEHIAASDRLRLERRLMETERDALLAILRADADRYSELSQIHEEPDTLSTAAATKQFDNGPLLSSALKQFADDSRDALALKTIMSNESDLREFIDIVGDKPVRQYTNEDGLRFKTRLRAVPSQRKVDPFKGLGITKCIEIAERIDPNRHNIRRLSVATVNNKIFAIGSFFEWANAQFKRVDNPLAGKRIATGKRKRSGKEKARKPLKADHLNTLFHGPIYTGCKSLRHWKVPGSLIPRTSARYWAPLIALYSGMRLGEIIQLRTRDYQISANGIAFLNVRTQLDEDDDEADPSLKNDNSIRQIPVHSALLKLGLADLVALRRAENVVRLFPEYDRASDESWSKTFSSWFRQYRTFLGVELHIRGVNRLVFHSFRHTFEDAVRNLPAAKKEFRDALQGRAEVGSSEDYGDGVLLERLHETIELVRYDDVDLSHLMKN